MTEHTKVPFDHFLSQLKETNYTLRDLTDFDKVRRNVADIEISLNTLNYLIGKDNLRSAVEALWTLDPHCFEVMDVLIATRKKKQEKFLSADGTARLVHPLFGNVDGIMAFLEGTGLSDIFRNKEIKNLVDYVFGVETGLDSNSRKNRTGKIMEQTVSKFFYNAGLKFQSQVYIKTLPQLKGILGKDSKRVDFVVKTPKTTYLVETNFYSTNGSKPNETARAYIEIDSKINQIEGYRFVWITDGQGWWKSKDILHEAYDSIPLVYNLTTIGSFIELVMQEEGIKK